MFRKENVNESNRIFFFFFIAHASDHTGSIVQRLVAEMNCLTPSYHTARLTS